MLARAIATEAQLAAMKRDSCGSEWQSGQPVPKPGSPSVVAEAMIGKALSTR